MQVFCQDLLRWLPRAKIFSLIANCLQTNSQEANQLLENIKQTIAKIVALINEEKSLQRELENEGESIQRDIGLLQQAQNSFRSNVDSLKASKAGLQSSLDSANSDLSIARSDKHRAEKKKDGAVARTVAGGVGAVAFGIFFPPSLAVTVPAVAAGGTISISNANREIDSCRSRISSIRGSIAEIERQISAANSEIATNQSRIVELDCRKQQLHVELGKVKNKSVFMLRAANYFRELQVTIEDEQNPTSSLLNFVDKANEEEQYTILNSEGVKIVAQSFAEAWKVVEDKIMSGDRENFMKITFVEVPADLM